MITARKSLRNRSRLDDTQPLTTRQVRSPDVSQNSTLPQPGCSRNITDSLTCDLEEDIQPSKWKATINTSVDSSDVSSDDSYVDDSRQDEGQENKKRGRKSAGKEKEKRLKAQKTSRVANPESLADKCVSFILMADHKKFTIKRSDIIKHVFEGSDSKSYSSVFKEARATLLKVFGFKLKEIKKNEYFVTNVLDRSLGVHEFAELPRPELHSHGFVFYILTLIFMNGNRIEEEKLWECLKPLGIDVQSRVPHPSFGDAKKFVSESLVRQLYLERSLVSRDPECYELTWGERAKAELKKRDCLEFACKIMDGTVPEDWILQFNESKSNNDEERMDDE